MSATKDATTATKSVSEFLRDKYPAKTAEHVAADTGCTVAAVKRWIYSDSAPSCACLLKLINAYGPELLSAVLPPSSWIERARAELHQEKLEADLADAEQRLAEFHARRGKR